MLFKMHNFQLGSLAASLWNQARLSRNNPFKTRDRGEIGGKWSSREEREWYRWGRKAKGKEVSEVTFLAL